MLKTEFIQSIIDTYSVDESEPFFPEIDRIADRALSIHKDTDNWTLVTLKDEYPMQLVAGSMIHYSRASKSAKTDFPVESMEGAVDKSALFTNNISIAMQLKREYLDIKAISGHTMHITSIGRQSASDPFVRPLNVVPTVAPAVITRAEADENYIYIDWTAPLDEWAFRRSVVYISEVDPYDAYSTTLVNSRAKASAYLYDLVLQRVKFRILPSGTYYVRVLRENLNGMRAISDVMEIEVP